MSVHWIPDEVYIRNRLDHINKNSHYGLMIDTEITKTVRNHLKRLEEATMHADCEFCVKRDICTGDVPKPCKYRYTEEERIADQASDQYGAILNNTYLHPTFRKKKEDNEMKATSVQKIKNVKDIRFTIENHPAELESKLVIVARTNDDIFAFEFEGPDFLQCCKRAGLFTGWEKDQKIKELEEELKISKDRANRLDKENDCLRENYMKVAKGEDIKEKNRKINDLYHQLHRVKRDKERLADRYKYLKTMNEEYSERINTLQRMYNLEKAANEAQHKFFRQYAGKGTEIEFNYAIGDTDETSYVIVDKEEYQFLKDHSCNVMLHGMDFTPDQLVDRILELEKLKTPTIENFEEPSNNVNHPSHYTGKYECIDVMQDVFGNEATDNFCLCNAFKYIWRANKKNGLEDVKKAVWYLNKYIEEAENGVRKGEQI